MERYETREDVIPHETTILVLNETDGCFGRPTEELLDAVRSALSCDKLLVEAHYCTPGELPAYDTLVQYGVWVVHHSCLLGDRPTPLDSLLRTESFPDETRVVAVVDDDVESDAVRAEIESEYGPKPTVVDSETALVYYLLGHLETATPCSTAGLDYLRSWNNKIIDIVGPAGDVE